MERFSIGIDFGGTHIKGAVVSESGIIHTQKTIRSEVLRGAHDTLNRMSDLILELSHQSPQPINAVGIGSPGPLSRAQGMIFQSPNLPGSAGWHNLPIKKILSEKIKQKIVIDNDANCAALGESLYGVARGLKHIVLLTFGTGIGGGILVDGQLLHGRNDGAAELGHFTLDPNGPLCACQKRGCFESHCSASAVRDRARALLPYWPHSSLHACSDLSASDISKAAYSGDLCALHVIDLVTTDIARGIGGLASIFDPEMFVLAGGLMRGGDLYIDQVRKKVPLYSFHSMAEGLRIEISSLNDTAGMLGAAAMTF